MGIITRYPALFGDHGDVVDEINKGHQSWGTRKSQENLSGLTSITHAASVKIAPEAPSIPVPRSIKGRLRTKLSIPPVKKTIRCLPGPTVFSKVFPKTNKKSMLPTRCKTFPWTNRAATSVQTLPFSKLAKLTTRLCSANIGGCCQAQMLATMQVNMSSELILK